MLETHGNKEALANVFASFDTGRGSLLHKIFSSPPHGRQRVFRSRILPFALIGVVSFGVPLALAIVLPKIRTRH